MRERFTKPLRSVAERTAGTLLWHGSSLVARHDVSYEYDNVARVKEHLARRGSLIVTINHAHTLDTVVAGHVIEDNISPLAIVTAITGLKHSDPDRYKFDKTVKRSEYVLIHLGKKSRSFRTLRVVQRSNEERE